MWFINFHVVVLLVDKMSLSVNQSRQDSYTTPAFYGVPNALRGDEIRRGSLTLALSGVLVLSTGENSKGAT